MSAAAVHTVTFVTIDTEEHAKTLANALVENEVAACVNIVAGVRSIYRWEGRLCDDGELLLVIKSRQNLFERMSAVIRQHHPYSVPEIISLPIVAGSESYLAWIDGVTR